MSMLKERTMHDLAQLSLRIFDNNSAFFGRYTGGLYCLPIRDTMCVYSKARRIGGGLLVCHGASAAE